MRALAVLDVVIDETTAVTDNGMETKLRHMRELTKNAHFKLGRAAKG